MDNRFLSRGKRLDNEKWIIGYYVYHEPPLQCFKEGNEKEGIHLIAKTGFADWGMHRPLNCYRVDYSTVGRCTSLTAAKSYRGERTEDRLIFEGDILQADDIFKMRFTVEWHNAQAGFNIIGINTKAFSIIGTVHENPELLEGSNEKQRASNDNTNK